MTQEEFKIYIEDNFFSTKTRKYNTGVDLLPKEENTLLDIRNIVKPDQDNTIGDFDNAFYNYIKPVVCGWLSRRSGKEIIPLLLCQILYYFCYMAYCYKVEDYQQKALIYKLNALGWNVKEYNFSYKFGIYPERLYHFLSKEQPTCFYPYKGAKTNEVGFGVRYVAFQAGAYSNFVDIFGGSGCASASVIHSNGTKYFYNEKNRHVRNLFEVLKDKSLCKKYIKEMKKFIYDLRHKVQKKSVFKNVDLDVEGYDAYASMKKKPLSGDILEIKAYKDKFVMSDAQALKAFNVVDENNKRTPKGERYCYDRSYSCSDILKLLNSKDMQNLNNQIIVEEYDAQAFFNPKEVFKGSYKSSGEKVTLREYLGNLETYYALGYWFYCQVLLNSSGDIEDEDKVKYAIASTYLLSMAVEGLDMNSNSEVLHFFEHRLASTKSHGGMHNTKKYDEFIEYWNHKDADVGKVFEKKVKAFHELIKDENISGYDAVDLVRNYSRRLELRYKNKTVTINGNVYKRSDKVLFYSDSPYEGTSDYKDEANGVAEFTKGDMVDLIQLLIDSEQKFIFSCRASTSGKVTKKKRENNKEIKQNVFDEFQNRKTSPLYVTVLLGRKVKEKSSSFTEADLIQRFEDAIKKNKANEIYITNYKVRYYYSTKFRTDYLVIDYDTFMRLEENNLQM